MSPKPIAAKVFAIYLKSPIANGPASGKLLLGGGDPSLYKHPLHYVHFNSEREYTFTLNSMKVGEGHLTIGINQNILLDTGNNALRIPQIYFNDILHKIEDEASKKAGAQIKFSWDPASKLWTVPCAYRVVMPPVSFWFGTKGDVLLTISQANYIRGSGSKCVLILRKTKELRWSLPDQTLVGKYFEFRPEEGRLGFSELAA